MGSYYDIELAKLQMKEAELRIKILDNILEAQMKILKSGENFVDPSELEAAKVIYKGFKS